MQSTATNRTAALAGAVSVLVLTAYTKVMGLFQSPSEVVVWIANFAVLGFIIFAMFRWAIGSEFKTNGDGLTFGEEWSAMSEKKARFGIFLLSACVVGVIANTLLSR